MADRFHQNPQLRRCSSTSICPWPAACLTGLICAPRSSGSDTGTAAASRCSRARGPPQVAFGPAELLLRSGVCAPYVIDPSPGGRVVPTSAADIDVLIVGAGPIGLSLANECARRSLRWRIVEQRAGQSEHSKALAIFPRTLEIFDMAALVAPFLAAANRVVSVAVVARDRRLAQFAFTPAASPYSFIAMVPQDTTEALLAQALRRRGGAVEYETSFVSATQRRGRRRAIGASRRASFDQGRIRRRVRRRAQHGPARARPSVRRRGVPRDVHAC
jgi:hypothetical protein